MNHIQATRGQGSPEPCGKANDMDKTTSPPGDTPTQQRTGAELLQKLSESEPNIDVPLEALIEAVRRPA